MPSEPHPAPIEAAQLLEALSVKGSIAGVLPDMPGKTEADVQQALRAAAARLRTEPAAAARPRPVAIATPGVGPAGKQGLGSAAWLELLPRFLCVFLGLNLLGWCVGFSWALGDWAFRRQQAGDLMFTASAGLTALLLIAMGVSWLTELGRRHGLAGELAAKLGQAPQWFWPARRKASATAGALALHDGSLHHLEPGTGSVTQYALARIRGVTLLPSESLPAQLRGTSLLRLYLADGEQADFSIPAGAACLRTLSAALRPSPAWSEAMSHERRRARPQLLWLGALVLAAAALWGGLVVQGWMRAQLLDLQQFRLVSIGIPGGQKTLVQLENRGDPALVHRIVLRDRFVVDFVPPVPLARGTNAIDVSAAVDADGTPLTSVAYDRLKTIVIETDQGRFAETFKRFTWSLN